MMNEGFDKLRKFTKAKDKEECRQLLEAVSDKDKFIAFIDSYINDNTFYDNIDFSGFDEPLSEGEFRQLHHKHQFPLLWGVLNSQKFSTYDALNPEMWLSISMQAIKNDIIKPSYLAYGTKSEEHNGTKEIELALLSLDDDSIVASKNTPMWLHVCRAILRRMFGAISERGIKGIFQDVPFAIAWRKIYLAKEISKSTGLDETDLVKYLVKNPTNYNDLVEKMGGKLTIVADKNIRDGLFKYLLDTKVTIDTKYFKDLTKRIGIESTWRGMGILTSEENKDIIGKLKV